MRSEAANTEAVEALRVALAAELQGSPDARYLHRLHCVLLVLLGHHATEVARWFQDDPSTVARWTRHFRCFGIEGLRDDKISGRPATLSHEQMVGLKSEMLQPPACLGYGKAGRWSGKLLMAHLQSRYGVVFSLRQCQRLLRQLQGKSLP